VKDEAILINRVWFRYAQDTSWTLRGIDLKVAGGEFVVLGGYSGAGKTTLFSCLNGVIPRLYGGELKGSIRVAGEEAPGAAIGRISRQVGTVLQDADAQIFNLQVDDELAFGCENLGLPPQEIAARIERYLPLTGASAHSATTTLSGGQKQRLTVASVLAMEQEVFLLDEPLANLDRGAAETLLAFLKEIAAAGKTVIMAEHRLDLALPHVTRLLWMEEGRIVDDLPAEQARSKYASLFRPQPAPAVSGKTAPPLLTLRDVYFSFNGVPVLQNLNFSLRQGEKVVLLGENGCGKTTFLRLLAGLIKPRQGELRCENMPVCRRTPAVGYVCQNPNYQLFAASVFREVDFRSESPENTRRFLELFGIESLRERHPHSLSEGQKRLVTIAAVAAMQPAALLLDEPTVGQDYRGLERLITALEELRRLRQTALLVVTHDRRCAVSMGERVLYMENGRLVEPFSRTGTTAARALNISTAMG